MKTGDLSRRATFQARVTIDDGYGNQVGGWGPDLFTRWCHVLFMRGSEAVIAGRLQGRQAVIITVRSDTATRGITAEMRCVIDGRAYNVRELPRPTDNRQFLEFMAESGVADG